MKMFMMKLYAVGILLLTICLLPGCKDRIEPGHSAVRRPQVTGVTVATLAPSLVDEIYETSGTVKAKMTAVIASRVFGTVSLLRVREGDSVQAGQILLAIDDRDAKERMNAAESGYHEALKASEAAEKQSHLAQVTAERYGNLYKEKVVSRQEFDQIETQKSVASLEHERASLAAEKAKALLRETRIQHDFTKIKAPFSGIVTSRKVEEGSMAVPGTPLLTVEDTSHFKIEASVDERLAGKISKGTPVKVHIDSLGETVQGTLTRVVSAVDPGSRSFAVEAELKGKALKSGLYGKVLIPRGTREAMLIPPASVVEKGQLTGVYTVDDSDIVSYRLIRKGKVFGHGVEVLSGLRKGDRIIVSGADRASDGGIVKDDKKGANAPQGP